jgi:hypothetical protein
MRRRWENRGVAEEVSTRTLMEKLGVKPGRRVSVVGIDDPDFLADLDRAGADVSHRLRRSSDLVVVAIDAPAALGRLPEMEPYLQRDGAVWVVFQKGRKELREVDVIQAGVAAGLVDNKVVRFSDSHTALRFVIPLARR